MSSNDDNLRRVFEVNKSIDKEKRKLICSVGIPQSVHLQQMIMLLGLISLSNEKFWWNSEHLELIIESGGWSRKKKIRKEKIEMNFSANSITVPLPTPKKMITLQLWDSDNDKNILSESFQIPDLDELSTIFDEGTNIPVENSDGEDTNITRPETVDNTG
ncbi:uncharacterized protein [Montipora capricornis]|uniref:uncharacterized protein n=1 Tax=Montipora capricornis TaxID=246305 RepID=UPI0035F1E7CB